MSAREMYAVHFHRYLARHTTSREREMAFLFYDLMYADIRALLLGNKSHTNLCCQSVVGYANFFKKSSIGLARKKVGDVHLHYI
jgi:hypothetical protein